MWMAIRHCNTHVNVDVKATLFGFISSVVADADIAVKKETRNTVLMKSKRFLPTRDANYYPLFTSTTLHPLNINVRADVHPKLRSITSKRECDVCNVVYTK